MVLSAETPATDGDNSMGWWRWAWRQSVKHVDWDWIKAKRL